MWMRPNVNAVEALSTVGEIGRKFSSTIRQRNASTTIETFYRMAETSCVGLAWDRGLPFAKKPLKVLARGGFRGKFAT